MQGMLDRAVGGFVSASMYTRDVQVSTTLRDQPTPFVCVKDRVALGFYHAASELGRTVPQNFSVVSLDDSDLARWLRPPLTSAAVPHFEIGPARSRIAPHPGPTNGRPTRRRGVATDGLPNTDKLPFRRAHPLRSGSRRRLMALLCAWRRNPCAEARANDSSRRPTGKWSGRSRSEPR